MIDCGAAAERGHLLIIFVVTIAPAALLQLVFEARGVPLEAAFAKIEDGPKLTPERVPRFLLPTVIRNLVSCWPQSSAAK